MVLPQNISAIRASHLAGTHLCTGVERSNGITEYLAHIQYITALLSLSIIFTYRVQSTYPSCLKFTIAGVGHGIAPSIPSKLPLSYCFHCFCFFFREETTKVKEGEQEKTKEYSALVWVAKEVTKEMLDSFSKLDVRRKVFFHCTMICFNENFQKLSCLSQWLSQKDLKAQIVT